LPLNTKLRTVTVHLSAPWLKWPSGLTPEAKIGSFTSVEDLVAKVLAFIDYYNRTMAKPFKWTYKGF
jgi:hypothetical protein